MKKRILVGLAVVMGLSAVAQSAMAEPTKKDDSYGYEFRDDILNADTKIATGAQINVRKKATRDRLHRVRVHFVTEMLKSVENM